MTAAAAVTAVAEAVSAVVAVAAAAMAAAVAVAASVVAAEGGGQEIKWDKRSEPRTSWDVSTFATAAEATVTEAKTCGA